VGADGAGEHDDLVIALRAGERKGGSYVEKLDIDCRESELRAFLERLRERVEETYEDVGDYDPVLRSHCRLEE
jgi:hypothetical protein